MRYSEARQGVGLPGGIQKRPLEVHAPLDGVQRLLVGGVGVAHADDDAPLAGHRDCVTGAREFGREGDDLQPSLGGLGQGEELRQVRRAQTVGGQGAGSVPTSSNCDSHHAQEDEDDEYNDNHEPDVVAHSITST